MEKKTAEDVVMRTWKVKVGGHRKIGRPKLRWSDDIRKDMKEKIYNTGRENVDIGNSMRQPQIGKRKKKIKE